MNKWMKKHLIRCIRDERASKILEQEEGEENIFELIWINIEPEDEYYSLEQGAQAMDKVREEMPGISIESTEQIANFGYGKMEMFKITGKPDDVHCVEERYYELCRDISEAECEK